MHAIAYVLVYLHLTVLAPYIKDAVGVGRDISAVVKSPLGQKAIARLHGTARATRR